MLYFLIRFGGLRFSKDTFFFHFFHIFTSLILSFPIQHFIFKFFPLNKSERNYLNSICGSFRFQSDWTKNHLRFFHLFPFSGIWLWNLFRLAMKCAFFPFILLIICCKVNWNGLEGQGRNLLCYKSGHTLLILHLFKLNWCFTNFAALQPSINLMYMNVILKCDDLMTLDDFWIKKVTIKFFCVIC